MVNAHLAVMALKLLRMDTFMRLYRVQREITGSDVKGLERIWDCAKIFFKQA